MNNNCSKCGNPLQPGTTICPICGTNNINANVAPAAPAPATNPAAAPVAPAPVANPAVAPTPVAPAPVADPAAAPAPVAPATPETPAAPGAPEAKPAKEKKPVNKKLFIIVGIIAALIVIGAVVAMVIINNSSSVPEPEPTSNNNKKNSAVVNKQNLNGFSFILPAGWLIDTTGGNTAIVDSGTTTIVQLLYEAGDINSLNKDEMNNYFTNNGFSNVSVNEKQIGGKKGIVVNTTKEGTSYQYDFYYIEGTDVIVGSGVVYSDSEAKNKNGAMVEQIMNSLSYSPTVNMASEISMHNDVITYFSQSLNGDTEPAPSINPDQPSNPETPENPSTEDPGRF